MPTVLRVKGISVSENEAKVIRFLSTGVANIRGVDIQKACEITYGSIYTVLQRMEKKNMITSHESKVEWGVIRYYCITDFGKLIESNLARLTN